MGKQLTYPTPLTLTGLTTNGTIQNFVFNRPTPHGKAIMVLETKRFLTDGVIGDLAVGDSIKGVVADVDLQLAGVNAIDKTVIDTVVNNVMAGLQVTQNRLNAALYLLNASLANVAQEALNAGVLT